jgi:aquaporin TIP
VEPSNKRLYAALAAEFTGMLLFALYGGEARDQAAAYGNGLTLAVLIYATANISGGHLNPAVTLGTVISGHLAWRRGLLYMAAQFLGGIVGAAPLPGVLRQPVPD